MAHQFSAQHQSHPLQMPPHHQNVGQQRQAHMGQQQMPAMSQQRTVPGQQPSQGHFPTNFDPKFALFTFEKPKGAESWEDVEAEQQHINAQDLQADVKKFQRNKRSVKNVLNEITSSNCRRLINELVKEENHKLLSQNRTLQWSIASVDVEWKTIGRRHKQLRRVSVILQTGPSGYDDYAALKNPTTMAAKPQPMQSQTFPLQPNHAGQETLQQIRNPPHPVQPTMGHAQPPTHTARMPQPHGQPPGQPPNHPHGPPPGASHGNSLGQPQPGHLPPPPPPPPLGVSNLPPPPTGAPPFSDLPPPPPPPPPGPAYSMSRPPAHGQQQSRSMPGSFPEPAHRHAIRPGQPDIEFLDTADLKRQKKPKDRHEESSSESELDSDEWESEPGDSASDRLRIHHVERGEFAHIGRPKRGRSRHSSRSKKSRNNKSHSKIRSRSRSRIYTETHRRHRDSDLIDPPPMGKYSPRSSNDNSPRSSKQQLPTNIHIHMNSTATENPTRANERVRRDSHGASSPNHRKDKPTAEPMSRGNSWDRHSGTASLNDNSSVHTADDSVFSEPDRHDRRSRNHSDIVEQSPKLRSRNPPTPQVNFGHPHPSHIYGDVEPRSRRNTYAAPNDYPHDPRHRGTYFDEQAYPRPGVHRRNSVQPPQHNPFDTTRFPPRLLRANTFAPGMHEPLYGHREPLYLSDRRGQGGLQLDDLADALEHLHEQKRRPLHGRRTSEYDRMGAYGGYDAYDRRY